MRQSSANNQSNCVLDVCDQITDVYWEECRYMNRSLYGTPGETLYGGEKVPLVTMRCNQLSKNGYLSIVVVFLNFIHLQKLWKNLIFQGVC